jgi:hypothetical protein
MFIDAVVENGREHEAPRITGIMAHAPAISGRLPVN